MSDVPAVDRYADIPPGAPVRRPPVSGALAHRCSSTSVRTRLVGAGNVAQLEQNVAALRNLDLYATESDINLWAASSAG